MKWFWSRPCRRRPEMSLLAAGALDEREKVELERHLAACDECQSYYGEIKTLIAPMAGWEKDFSVIEATPAQQKRWAKVAREAGFPSAAPNPWSIAWRELFWPTRYAWAGMAALWLAMLAINARLSETGTSGVGARPATAREIMQALEQSNRVLAELAQPGFGVPVPPADVPRPRSQRKEDWAII